MLPELASYCIALIMLTEKQVLAMVRAMPDPFDEAQLFDRILLIDRVEEGRKHLTVGKGLSAQEAKKKLKTN
ncbi:MAG TPA: hypothetical protein VGS79_14395 [Puia sp.]|nr:hypothetical protein [Puia sp.]